MALLYSKGTVEGLQTQRMFMPSEREIKCLLEKICVDLGLCLTPLMKKRLVKFPPKTPSKFADAIIKAEGLNPITVEKSLYQAVLSTVERAFK